MKKTIILNLAYLLTMATACHHKQAEQKMDQAVAVKTQKVSYQDYAVPITSSGMVTSENEARLSFKTGGMISRMHVKEGQSVYKGQLLAILNMTEVNALVSQLQSANSKAKRDYTRVGNLLKDSAITQEQWENAGTQLQMSTEALKIASYNKEMSAIYATVSGTVIKKLYNEGEMAAPGAPVYIINSTNKADWVIRIGVSDKDWARLRLNDKAAITLDAYPGQTFAGAVSKIAQASDINAGTFAVEVKIDPKNQKLANGLIGKIQISPTITNKVCLVPIEAIQEADVHSGHVFSISKNRKEATVHQVQIAYILKDMVAVTSGLENVNEVITQGGAYLSDKQSLEIKN